MYGTTSVWYDLTNPGNSPCSNNIDCVGILQWGDGTPLQSQSFNTAVSGEIGADLCGVGTNSGTMGVFATGCNETKAFFCQGEPCVGNDAQKSL